jgi:hypothetical protein
MATAAVLIERTETGNSTARMSSNDLVVELARRADRLSTAEPSMSLRTLFRLFKFAISA